MTYNDGLVCVVKVGKKVIREEGSLIYLPFGCEYSLGLKNLTTKKAKVSIEIDGESIGDSLILSPNESIDLERNISLGSSGNKFKFIEKTEQISNHRSDRVDDGIIRVEYDFERQYNYRSWPNEWPNVWLGSSPDPLKWDAYPKIPETFMTYCSSDVIGSTTSGRGSSLGSFNNVNDMGNVELCYKENGGITVPGSFSNQSFVTGYIGCMEGNPKTIVLQLRGYHGKRQVTQVVTTKTKIRCNTCGWRNSSGAKFCSNCGTSLIKY